MDVFASIYLLKDSHGNKASITARDICDNVSVYGLKDKSYNDVYFESEGYHLDEFCRKNEIEIRVINQTYDFDTLWDNKTKQL